MPALFVDSHHSAMSASKRNLAVVYDGLEKVVVKDIGYPQLKDPQGNPAQHAVIVKVSSDQDRTLVTALLLPPLT